MDRRHGPEITDGVVVKVLPQSRLVEPRADAVVHHSLQLLLANRITVPEIELLS